MARGPRASKTKSTSRKSETSARYQSKPSTSTSKPTLPHKDPWDDFSVECEVGRLVCSFRPGGPHPEGFSGPFQDRFAEYLGLKASIGYHIERTKGKGSTVWVLHYRLKEGDEWIRKAEVLKGCTTEDEATLAASRLMTINPAARVGMVHILSGLAKQKFLAELQDALTWALKELITYSCDYVKITKSETPQARHQDQAMQRKVIQQTKEKLRQLGKQIQNEDDPSKLENARGAIKNLQGFLHVANEMLANWKPFQGLILKGYYDDDDERFIAKCPPVIATALRDEALARVKERLVGQYGVTPGGTYGAGLSLRRKPAYDWKNKENQRAFRNKVEELRPLWIFITEFFKDNHYDADCPATLKTKTKFQDLARACTKGFDDLIHKVFDRKNKGGKALWPSSFALQHAARELDIKGANDQPYKVKTLETYFLKARRTQH